MMSEALNTVQNEILKVDRNHLVHLLSTNDEEEIKDLFHLANHVRKENVGDEVFFRGVVEISNYCESNCYFCGIREDNFSIPRYRMKPDEIIETIKLISNLGIKSIILKSGKDTFFDTDLIAYLIYTIKKDYQLNITLSLEERGIDEYKTWRIAGADRYLLKHESSNAINLRGDVRRGRINTRSQQLNYLKRLGYKVGYGIMIGLPKQEIPDIADDLLLLHNLQVNMATIAPFIAAPFTPYQNYPNGDVKLTLKTLAIARILLPKAYIPSPSALESLDSSSRDTAFNCGANVAMLNFTPVPYRGKYKMYPEKLDPAKSKPLDDLIRLRNRITFLGRKVNLTMAYLEKPSKNVK